MADTQRRLGRTDITVSTVAMGCWAIVGDATWGPQDDHDAIAAIHAALDSGVTFFDTAEGYGSGLSERLLARALKGRRDEVVIGSKVSPNHVATEADLVRSCDASLANLETDVIDVYHLHWPNRAVPIDEILAGFERLRQAGKIRAMAVSNFGRQDLTELLAAGRCEANQLPYNLLWRAIEHEVAPICVEHEIGITCYCPIAQGLLTGKFASPDEVPPGRARTRHFACTRPQARHTEPGAEAMTFAAIAAIRRLADGAGLPMEQVALAWLLTRPGVASVLVGARDAAQMRRNAAAMTAVLSPALCADLEAVTDGLKQHFGTNPDMWQSQSRYR
ncbi:MAG: aldo/keto reductase [Lentisphaerae bacterium]|nr:aldo/keto reductase [Lentisphaerota bacterium]